MLRIITGTAKNKRLLSPNIEGYRGVQEIVKGSVFAILGDEIKDKVCLDLFAGSGNVGFEALSRGAASCDFVDEHPLAIQAIEKNAQNCGFTGDQVQIIRNHAVKFVGNTPNKYDIIFLDPFYHDTAHIFLVKNLEEILNKEGLIVFFHGDQLDIEKTIKDTDLKIVDQRKFGKSFFTMLKHS